MTKKTLAAAIVSAIVVAPAAHAEAVMYGKMHNAIENVNPIGSEDSWQVNDHASRLGFKGSEDLGGGLKAIYQIELGVTTDGGNGQAAGGTFGSRTRNTFVGLAGNWGTFIVGRRDTPMKSVFYGNGNERLGDSIIDINSGVVGAFTEARVNNAIAYISPSVSGFTVAAAAVPGEGPGTSIDGIADHYSLGAMYKGGGLKASIGYESLDLGTDVETFQAGASYTFGSFSVGAQYENTDGASTRNPLSNALGGGSQIGSDRDYTAWGVTGKATFGNNAISLVYTDSEGEQGSTTVNEAESWGVAAEHNFSKRTKVYAAYGTRDENTGAEAHSYGLGMIHSF